MKHFLSVIIMACLNWHLFDQQIFVPGIVFMENDTIEGFILRPSKDKEPELIFFTEFEGGPSLSYRPDEIAGFEITGKEYFRSAELKVDKTSINEEETQDENKSSKGLESLFLRRIVNGNASLFCHRNQTVQLFFIEMEGIPLQELVNEEYSITNDDENQVKKPSGFRETLAMHFSDCEEAVQDIDALKYDYQSLEAIFKAYNDCGIKKN